MCRLSRAGRRRIGRSIAAVGLNDVAGVFSKYFVVGFFIPAFFTLAALKIVLSDALVPGAVQKQTAGSFAAIGAVALLVALLVLGLDYPLTRLYEGYPLKLPYRNRTYAPIRWLGVQLTAVQRWRRRKLVSLIQDPDTRAAAAWLYERRYPYQESALMPTRLGNTIRAFEEYSRSRWGLDGIVFWPHVVAILPPEEQQLHDDARGDFAFFRNASLGSFVAAWVMLADLLANHPHPNWLAWIYALPFVLVYAFYVGSAGAAERWGMQVRASFDLHRFDLYDKLGLRRPRTLWAERAQNEALSSFLLWSEPPLPDAFRAPEEPPARPD
jgi:hypothetical protein